MLSNICHSNEYSLNRLIINIFVEWNLTSKYDLDHIVRSIDHSYSSCNDCTENNTLSVTILAFIESKNMKKSFPKIIDLLTILINNGCRSNQNLTLLIAIRTQCMKIINIVLNSIGPINKLSDSLRSMIQYIEQGIDDDDIKMREKYVLKTLDQIFIKNDSTQFNLCDPNYQDKNLVLMIAISSLNVRLIRIIFGTYRKKCKCAILIHAIKTKDIMIINRIIEYFDFMPIKNNCCDMYNFLTIITQAILTYDPKIVKKIVTLGARSDRSFYILYNDNLVLLKQGKSDVLNQTVHDIYKIICILICCRTPIDHDFFLNLKIHQSKENIDPRMGIIISTLITCYELLNYNDFDLEKHHIDLRNQLVSTMRDLIYNPDDRAIRINELNQTSLYDLPDCLINLVYEYQIVVWIDLIDWNTHSNIKK